MAWNKEEAIKFAEDNAHEKSTGWCSTYVKNALVKGGLTYFQCDAGSCGGGLQAQGFTQVKDQNTDDGQYEVGDVVVISAFADPDGEGPKKGSKHGHLAIWNGLHWISDFHQNTRGKNVYPGAGYDMAKPNYKIYRNTGR